jgi:uncharacterized alpha-E superfamily protein
MPLVSTCRIFDLSKKFSKPGKKMLGKDANGMFWMYRYLERAENTARLIETGQRIALTRLGNPIAEWHSVLQTAGVEQGYGKKYGQVNKETMIDWLLRDADNPSSVRESIQAARRNARMVRTSITADVWEAVNQCYLMSQALLSKKTPERELPILLEKIRQTTALVRGVTNGTMLRNDIYDFSCLGTFFERADNTARILDVKYFVLLPSVASVGTNLDNVQWESILRSVSAHGGFRLIHGNTPNPLHIAHFMILDKRMPRSLAFSFGKLRKSLAYLVAAYGTETPSHQLTTTLIARYFSMSIEDIFDSGLHEYLQRLLTDMADLGRQIEVDYRFYH